MYSLDTKMTAILKVQTSLFSRGAKPSILFVVKMAHDKDFFWGLQQQQLDRKGGRGDGEKQKEGGGKHNWDTARRKNVLRALTKMIFLREKWFVNQGEENGECHSVSGYNIVLVYPRARGKKVWQNSGDLQVVGGTLDGLGMMFLNILGDEGTP